MKLLHLTTLIFCSATVACSPAKSNAKPKAKSEVAPASKSKLKTAPKVDEAPANSPIAVFETNLGRFEIQLRPDLAPITVKNFTDYVNEGFYTDLIFHRIIKGFMAQGGGFEASMKQRTPKATIKNEANNGLSNVRGSVAMARTNVVDSATSQFFVNLVNNARLDHRGPGPRFGYCVFGKVIAGMEVVDAMAKIKTKRGDVPESPIVIKKAFMKK